MSRLKTRFRSFALLPVSLVVVFVFGVISHADESEPRSAAAALPEQSVAEEVSSEQIADWIGELDANLFNTREEAQRRLEKVGVSALEAVADAADNRSLESATRAINVLLAWSESPDRELSIAALERLAQLKSSPREAAIADKLLATARENAALATIVEMGGSFQRDRYARTIQPTLHVTIGKKWTGSESGLKYLADVSRATTVSLHCAPLGDEALDYLKGLPQLKRVEIYGPGISNEAIANFEAEIPNDVTVDIRPSGAFLGIRGDENGVRAIVGGVEPDSAAEKAGLQVGDVILELDGEEVGDFASLTRLIAQQEPGSTVNLTVNRDTKVIKVPVKFSSWGIKQLNTPVPIGQFQDQVLQLPHQQILIDRR